MTLPIKQIAISLAAATVAAQLVAAPSNPESEARRVMNIVNFVRACDPRFPGLDMTKVLREEVWFNKLYKFKNTILLQYDAMLSDDLMDVARSSDPELTEFGLWFEVVKPLCDRLGIAWRGREGWDWDWHACPAFLMAYTVADRERLCDEMMRLFKEKFGRLPESVGCWIIDAHSMAYMSEKYGVKAFCICREQDSTDAEGLRGGYSNGAYYPSRRNMLSAARDMKNAIRTPVFRMLTPCPIYNYGWPHDLYGEPRQLYGVRSERECPTMEPVWYGGNSRDAVDWYFDTYVRSRGLLNLSYMQTGQENGFVWDRVALGLPYQMKKIMLERRKGPLVVETLAETGKRFAADHDRNCPQTQVALSDWSGCGRKSVWYNSRCYRANLILEKGRLSFRDIHVMKDDFDEPYFDTACSSKSVEYMTPPLVDKWLDRGDAKSGDTAQGDMAFDGEFVALGVETPSNDTLVVSAARSDGSVVTVTFEEERAVVRGASLAWNPCAARLREISCADGCITRDFEGYRHSVGVIGNVESTDAGFLIAPAGNEVVFRF